MDKLFQGPFSCLNGCRFRWQYFWGSVGEVRRLAEARLAISSPLVGVVFGALYSSKVCNGSKLTKPIRSSVIVVDSAKLLASIHLDVSSS